MKIKELLADTEKQFEATGIATARLDALILIEDFLERDRSWILANPDYRIAELSTKFVRNVNRRQKHEPLAYIRGKSEFYRREFLINKHVLVPRPESESMIELLLTLEPNGIIVDVGTGSGALAISAKLELPKAHVIAIDVDPKCLNLAQKNADKHKASIEYLQSNLLSNLPTKNYKLITILANLPYVPVDYMINDAAKHEPRLAIFGGKDGLDLYRQLFEQLSKFLVGSSRFTVLTESLPFQHIELAKIADKAGFKQIDGADLIQVFKTI